jgi:hypothetical protein
MDSKMRENESNPPFTSKTVGFLAALTSAWLVACSGGGDTTVRNHFSTQPPAAANMAGSNAPGGAIGIVAASPTNPSSNPSGVAPLIPVQNNPGGPPPPTTSKPVGIAPANIDQCAAGNAAGLTDADVQKLAAAANPMGMKWLYPYEATVFPRGMGAPLLMWDSAATATAVYVHIKAKAFEYRGCLKPAAAGMVVLPQDVWVQAGDHTYGKSDPYTLELSVLAGGVANGPLTLHFTIAQATIKGSIYYNSYESKLNPSAAAGGFGGTSGMVLRIPQNGPAEVFASDGCVGCHSVSADGSHLIAQLVPGSGQGYELVSGAATTPKPTMAGPRGAYGAMYPDGSAYLSMGGQIDVARSTQTQGQGALAAATVYDAATGAVIASKGVPVGALMPMISPDGTLLVFNDYAIGMGDGLAIMKYDVKTHTASDYKELFKDKHLHRRVLRVHQCALSESGSSGSVSALARATFSLTSWRKLCESNGLSSRSFSIRLRNSRAFAVNAPPVRKITSAASSGRLRASSE